MTTFTHLDERGKARMVDITSKEVTTRQATARATVRTQSKFDAAVVCEMAARTGVQRTSSLIPLCHPIPIDDVAVQVLTDQQQVFIDVTVTTDWRTGVEMEALTGAAIAALTAVKAIGPQDATIVDIALLQKSGGRSGLWGRDVTTAETNNGRTDSNQPYDN